MSVKCPERVLCFMTLVSASTVINYSIYTESDSLV